MDDFALATEVARGKTKKILLEQDGKTCRVVSFDDITAGDGKKHAVIRGKGAWSTRMTANIFRYLAQRGVPVAFRYQDMPHSFVAEYCTMLPLEIVGRFRVDAKSSYRKRHPSVLVDQLFETPVVEYFLKTTGRHWKGRELPCDDPFLAWDDTKERFDAYLPNKPVSEQTPVLSVLLRDLELNRSQFAELGALSNMVALVLKKAFDSAEADLADFKWEAGITAEGAVVVADVIDMDSVRVRYRGKEISKQAFRDDADLSVVKENFEQLAGLTEEFA